MVERPFDGTWQRKQTSQPQSSTNGTNKGSNHDFVSQKTLEFSAHAYNFRIYTCPSYTYVSTEAESVESIHLLSSKPATNPQPRITHNEMGVCIASRPVRTFISLAFQITICEERHTSWVPRLLCDDPQGLPGQLRFGRAASEL